MWPCQGDFVHKHVTNGDLWPGLDLLSQFFGGHSCSVFSGNVCWSRTYKGCIINNAHLPTSIGVVSIIILRLVRSVSSQWGVFFFFIHQLIMTAADVINSFHWFNGVDDFPSHSSSSSSHHQSSYTSHSHPPAISYFWYLLLLMSVIVWRHVRASAAGTWLTQVWPWRATLPFDHTVCLCCSNSETAVLKKPPSKSLQQYDLGKGRINKE